jgi:hypothetical protein
LYAFSWHLFCVVGRGNLLHFRSAIPEKTRTSTRKSLPSVETVMAAATAAEGAEGPVLVLVP